MADELTIGRDHAAPLHILCVGAHCDDIEIGCGATLKTMQKRSRGVTIDWAILSGTAERRAETATAMKRLVKAACRGCLRFGSAPDGRFPAAYDDVKSFLESLKGCMRPDLIFTHQKNDAHQDHRIVNEVVWNTFRDPLVLEFEIPKWDGDLGQPNVFVPVSARDAAAKVDTLVTVYRSQGNRDWFSRETFLALMRLRGIECRSPSGYAEAFHGRKVQVGV